jgi:queuine tRNA-ribosyltransferase
MNEFFKVIARDGSARRGVISLSDCSAETPLFMPVGTQATVKGMTPADLEAIGFTIILSNTYHLYLRPGTEVIGKMGGLHRFMGWGKGILTDSGGFQVFSLRDRRVLSDEGVEFRSHIDGSKHFFTPEGVVAIQEILGSDIIMPLDECVPSDATWEYVKESLKKTHDWARRSLVAKKSPQHLFGIIQGGIHVDLRHESARALCQEPFAGFSIGGLSVGESKEVMYHVLEETTPQIPDDRPRYLMGVGAPEDLVEGVARGVDMFDCVLPTRMGRTGTFLTSVGKLIIKNARHRSDDSPVDEGCRCYACRNFSRSYLRHLFMADEMLGSQLATYHNLFFLHSLMEGIKASLSEGKFSRFREEFLARYFQEGEKERGK